MHMRTRFYNAQVLTMKDFNIFSGEVWIEDHKIIYVGKVKESSFCFDREIDVQNNFYHAWIHQCTYPFWNDIFKIDG